MRVILNYKIKTFGCRLNFYESEVIRKYADENKIKDTTFINSCAVTNKTVKDLKNTIKKLKKDEPENKIVLTGCAAQIHTDEFRAIKNVDAIIGNREKLENTTYERLQSQLGSKKYTNISNILEDKKAQSPIIDKVKDKIRAFVQIQNGCDHRCTFCIIPFGRGNSRSVNSDIIIEQIKKLINKGYKEVVLTGVDLTSYGHDLENYVSLGKLIKIIFKAVPTLKRLRLSSLDVAEMDEDLLDVIENENRLLPHIHLSLQSGDNMILKRMKRRHTRDNSIQLIKKLKSIRPDIVFGSDFIAGFPTETDEMFMNTVKLIEECSITFLHIFPFSPREGTPAARMPQVPYEIIKKRAKILRSLGEKKLIEYYENLTSKKVSVIVESKNRGRTDTFAKISISDEYKNGDLLNMTITGYNSFGLTGEVVV
tara:strand:- start:2004 stop:3275 length:1272 start_codon:yes stop_codon:yes gene_type:complete